MNCWKCGTKSLGESKFCTECGSSLSTPSTKDTIESEGLFRNEQSNLRKSPYSFLISNQDPLVERITRWFWLLIIGACVIGAVYLLYANFIHTKFELGRSPPFIFVIDDKEITYPVVSTYSASKRVKATPVRMFKSSDEAKAFKEEWKEIQKATAVAQTANAVTIDTIYEWDDISLEYKNNAIVANSKYLNKTISIRGKIYEIDYFYTSDYQVGEVPTVWLKSLHGRLLCGLDYIDKVGNLSVGDTVVVRGKIIEWAGDVDFLFIYPCSIVD